MYLIYSMCFYHRPISASCKPVLPCNIMITARARESVGSFKTALKSHFHFVD